MSNNVVTIRVDPYAFVIQENKSMREANMINV